MRRLKEHIEKNDFIHHGLVVVALWILSPPFITETLIAGFLVKTFNLSFATSMAIIYIISILILVFLAPSSLKKIWNKIVG